MAVTEVASGQAYLATGHGDWDTPVDVSIAPSGANRLLLVGVVVGAGDNLDGNRVITDVTFNSTSLGSPIATRHSNDQTAGYISLYSMVNPPTGGADLVSVTHTGFGADNGGSNIDTLIVFALCFTVVDQATPLGTPVTAIGSDTAPTVTVASAGGDLVVDFFGAGHSRTACAQDPNYIAQNVSGQTAASNGGMSWKAGEASTVLSWTLSQSDWWASAGVNVNAAAGGGGGGTGLMWLH